jgi:hypothetical protein
MTVSKSSISSTFTLHGTSCGDDIYDRKVVSKALRYDQDSQTSSGESKDEKDPFPYLAMDTSMLKIFKSRKVIKTQTFYNCANPRTSNAIWLHPSPNTAC